MRGVSSTATRGILNAAWRGSAIARGGATRLAHESATDGKKAAEATPIRYATHSTSGLPQDERHAHAVLYALQACGQTGASLAAQLARFGPMLLTAAGEAGKALISPRVEKAIGQEVAARITLSGRGGRSEDVALQARLDDVATRVVSGAERRETGYEFRLLKGSALQAAAVPGGIVLVNEGTLRQLESDDALGFVLGHEVGHVERRDTLDGFQFSALRMQHQRLAERDNPHSGDAHAIGTLLDSYYNRYVSQPAELRADRRGIALAHAVGYDPRASLAVLETLARNAQRAGLPKQEGERGPSIARTPAHPPYAVRIAQARAEVATLQSASR